MSFENPLSVLYNAEGVEVSVTSSQPITASQPGIPVMGSSSFGWTPVKLNDFGELVVTGSLSSTISGAVDQGNAGTVNQSWYVTITDGVQVIGTGSSAPLFVSGSVAVDNTVNTQITGTVEITGSVEITSIATPVTTREISCPTTVVTGFAASTISVQALSPNPNRCNALFFMDGNAIAFIKLGISASNNSFSIRLINGGYWEMPVKYTGRIDVVFDKDDSSRVLRITEISE